ncbi:hypothetical protein PI2015_2010 [Pseudoalteromonas issachenkonii]|uniref:hypothetical protein n=1 Tax=Pseudoalteromonas TaxID=53246 RepID=UPI00051815B1|nr:MULTISPECIES: hypothetical protein [Pseudoalteromonas]ALQ55295.1 hypothetical protein PI2015_2010 [Pseudoalteromonas issachenkonii]MDN3395300.1 hypothetical protein [Pseudoalteromonas sp. APC 3215]MDN3470470.1 hypothetical protein [Pseudoalteromonas sp. APC 4026]
MVYSEYLNAARKHYATCEALKTTILGLDLVKAPDKVNNKHFRLNLYYLTGYIFECSIKYGIYKLVNHDLKTPINELNVPGIDFANDIKKHRFDRYSEHLIVRHAGIKLVDDRNSVPPEVVKLYNSWDAPVRYLYNDSKPLSYSMLENKHLFTFLDCAREVLKTVERL